MVSIVERRIGIQHRFAIEELAHHGSSTVISEYGKPYAALVPLSSVASLRRRVSVLTLSGTGVGLWGDDSSKTVTDLRNEWE